MAKTPNTSSSDDSTEPERSPEPTPQVAPETAPIAASTAQTETGMSSEPEPSLFRRHPLATGIAAVALGVVFVSGLTAWGVGTVVTASLTSSTSSSPMGSMSMPSATPTPNSQANGSTNSKGKPAGQIAFRATIQSIDGSSWTILTKKGKTVTVAVDDSTQFGTKRMTQTQGDFATGDSVVIVAMRGTNGQPTATRVVMMPAGGTTGTTGTSSDGNA